MFQKHTCWICGYIISLILFSLCSPSDAATWAKTFDETQGDSGTSIQQTSDGGYILIGETRSFGAGGRNVLVLRLDSSGNIRGCENFNNINMAVNTPSVTVNGINSTVTNPNQSMANVGVTVNTPSVTAGTTCTYTGRHDDLVVDFGNFNAGINVYYNNAAPWTSVHPYGPGEGRMAVGDLDEDGKADLIVDFGNFNAGINVYYNNATPWTSIHNYSPGESRMVTGNMDGN